MKKIKDLGSVAASAVKKAPLAALFVGVLLAGSLAASGDVASAQGTFEDGLTGGLGQVRSDDMPESIDGDGGVFQTVVNVLLFIVGAISVIMLIFGGIRYTTSGGDQGSVTAAKNTVMYAVIGIVVAILAYAIVNFVITALSSN